uniref:Uncharacterized protein n=1 Tax=Anser brachyrhynchus TaxID=132585 RepID=A0A8B9CFL5_9AVES
QLPRKQHISGYLVLASSSSVITERTVITWERRVKGPGSGVHRLHGLKQLACLFCLFFPSYALANLGMHKKLVIQQKLNKRTDSTVSIN